MFLLYNKVSYILIIKEVNMGETFEERNLRYHLAWRANCQNAASAGKKCYLYFMIDANWGLMKIGISNNPFNRLQVIRRDITNCFISELWTYACKTEANIVERFLHSINQDRRVIRPDVGRNGGKSEWFLNPLGPVLSVKDTRRYLKNQAKICKHGFLFNYQCERCSWNNGIEFEADAEFFAIDIPNMQIHFNYLQTIPS